jgi:hypothetical protein
MSRENSSPAKSQRRVGELPAKALSGKESGTVRGGKNSSAFFRNCCQGRHYDKANLFFR